MRPERIKQMIDNNIQKMLVNQDFEQIRTNLFWTCKKFRISTLENLAISEIQNIKDIRTKYKMYYIYFAERRIADLVRIQFSNKNFNFSNIKKFNLLLFKEKLDSGDDKKIFVSKKYLDIIKKIN